MEGLNLDAITLQDCEENYQYRDRVVVLQNGRITGIVEERKNPIRAQPDQAQK